MLRYFSYKRKGEDESSSTLDLSSTKDPNEQSENNSSKKSRVESHHLEPCPNPIPIDSPSSDNEEVLNVDMENPDFPEYVVDPGKRPRITSYDPDIRERIRKMYYLKGATQPRDFKFPQREMNGKLRRFSGLWFEEFKWLEYSTSKDAAFCLYCYLFKNELGHQGGSDVLVSERFRNWKRKDTLSKHEEGVNSPHNRALRKCQDLFNEKQRISPVAASPNSTNSTLLCTNLSPSTLYCQSPSFSGRNPKNLAKLRCSSYNIKGEVESLNNLDSSSAKDPTNQSGNNCSRKSPVEPHLSELCPSPRPTSSDNIEGSNVHVEKPDFPEYIVDPGKRPRITSYDPNIRERVRQMYYLNGPTQPRDVKFPPRDINGHLRRFSGSWFGEFTWLEYSTSKDAAFCLYCYLFKNELGHQGGGEAFVSEGFRNWKCKDRLRKHEGEINSAHNKALRKCQDLFNEKQHIDSHLSQHCPNPIPIDSPSLGNKEVLNVHVEKPDFPEYEVDPGKRPRITSYHPNIRERIRRMYYLNGATQPRDFKFPQREINGDSRRFCGSWFGEFKWLEYSIDKDAAFCLYCYLFKSEFGNQGGGDVFVSEGFRNWKKKDALRRHEGEINSSHNQALRKCQDLLNEKQHIESFFVKMTGQEKTKATEGKDTKLALLSC